jgi:nucleoid-associated protein YgaU
VTWYLLAVTLLGVAVRLARSVRLVRLTDAVTLPPVRRFLRSSVGAVLAAGVVATSLPVAAPLARIGRDGEVAAQHARSEIPTDAASAPGDAGPGAGVNAPSGWPRSGRPLPLELAERGVIGDLTGTEPEAIPDGIAPDVADGAASGAADGEVRELGAAGMLVRDAVHEVEPGESLWSIARDALTDAWGRAPTDGEMVGYWRAVVEVNRSRLADPDNPDLIFPGQQVVLPPAPVAPS